MSERLVWPPIREDLERLYLVEKLSAAKIAKVYGIRYASPKTAESTVLYHLKRNGIIRRDKADHARKVSSEMAEEWIRRYQDGESLKQIAGDLVDPVTVFNHLHKRGIALRDKVEAQIKATTKHQRKPFDGTDEDRWYLMGLRYGDLHAVEHGRAIRLRVSTTRPAMAELFESLFMPYGYVHHYPREAKLIGYEWTLECDLDRSFDFLLQEAREEEIFALSESLFLSFLAGIVDAEGTVTLHKKRGRSNPEIIITNTDEILLGALRTRLSEIGMTAREAWERQNPDRGGIKGEGFVGRVRLERFLEVQKLLEKLPLKHSEKAKKAGIVLKMRYGIHDREQAKLFEEWEDFKVGVCESRDRYLKKAEAVLANKRAQSRVSTNI